MSPVYNDGGAKQVKFFPKRINGRTGRGDTCLASYVAKRLSASSEEALIWAAAITSLKMENDGPFNRDIHEVEFLIDQKYR